MATYLGRFLILAKLASEWSAANPVLMAGELGVADPGSSTPMLKVGDGVRPWSALPQVSGSGGGASPDYVVGSTTTLAPGSFATVTIDNIASPPTISFGIPRGNTGPPNSLAIGTVSTGAPGSPAGATITGSAPSQTLSLTIPQGAVGPAGADGADGATGPTGAAGPANSLAIGTVTTGAAGSSAAASITGTPPSQTLSLTIPRGDVGPAGPPGPAGSTANLGDPTAQIGLTAINGISPDALRCDGAPALSQAIAPTWSGAHTFALSLDVTGLLKLDGSEGTAGQVLVSQGAGVTPQWASALALANPSASIGLTAVNGSAITAMRSDAAPALSQAIAPTWTGAHTFALALDITGLLKLDGTEGTAGQVMVAQGAGLTPQWSTPLTLANPSASIGLTAVNGSGVTAMRSDAAPALSQAIVPTWSALHTFSITPVVPNNSWTYAKLQDVSATARVLGRITAGAGDIEELTGADLATILGGAVPLPANPSASLGLAAINGAATTYMRSDAAPALSQAIVPTWSGAHTFNGPVNFASEFRASGVEGLAGQVWAAQGAGLPAVWRSAGSGSIDMTFKFATAVGGADPGNQFMAMNSAVYASVTSLVFDEQTSTNFEAATILSLLRAGNRIYLQQSDDSTKAAIYEVTGAATDNGTYWSVPVLFINQGSSGTMFGASKVVTAVFILSSSSISVANPTASIGLTAVNGSATTAMRSDAAPALAQTIAPTWTGVHNFGSASSMQTTATIGARGRVNGFEFGHSNVAGYASTLGYGRANGRAFVALHAEHGTTDNTFKTRGIIGRVLTSDAAGAMIFGRVPLASADDQALTTDATIAVDGGLFMTGATGGSKGAGTVNATNLYVNGTAIAIPVGANPSASVGLTAANGSAVTFMRSDGAPALSQSIAPTWTGLHKFARAGASEKLRIIASDAVGDGFLTWYESDDTTRKGYFGYGLTSTDSLLLMNEENDSLVLGTNAINRVTIAADGGLSMSGATGGSQGNGSINAAALYINGVAVGTGGGAAAANPTGTIGLAVVNGVAATFMRSDAAPPLSQAISPTWSGQHIFSNPVRGTFGSLSVPGFCFDADPDNGVMLSGANLLTLVAGGFASLNIDSSSLQAGAAVQYRGDGGTVTAPQYTFDSDTNTGVFRVSADIVGVAAGGVEGLRVASTGASSPSFTTTSSRKIKRETGAPTRAASILAKLRPLLYRLLEGDGHEQLGLIAEEVHEVCPQLSDGKAVAYDRLAILLLAAWQAEHAEVA